MSDIRHELVKARRKELKVSPADVAASLNITRQQYNRIENGSSNPSVPVLRALCDKLNLRPTELLKTDTFVSGA